MRCGTGSWTATALAAMGAEGASVTAALFRLRERNDSRGLRVLSVALRLSAEQAAAPSPHRRADRAISNPLESLQVTNEQYDTRMGAFRGLSVTINSGSEHNTCVGHE